MSEPDWEDRLLILGEWVGIVLMVVGFLILLACLAVLVIHGLTA